MEGDVDAMLRAQLLKPADREEGASDTAALIVAAHRIENVIHHRRMLLAAKASSSGEAG